MVSFSYAQQMPDTLYTFDIQQAAWPNDEGPVILIDGAHNNFHTRDGGFTAFTRLLEQDGYRVKAGTDLLDSKEPLKAVDILVIANPLHADNIGNWVLPNPSAFSEKEIKVISDWVESGGKLLLIADHMPFAGAAQELGAAFGFEFINGFARTGDAFWPPSVFFREQGLADHAITNGLKKGEKIERLSTFTGSAFQIPDNATPIISFAERHISLQPDTAWRFNPETERLSLAGFHQGAVLPFGEGQLAVFGEAAMFTAQVTGNGLKAGFNSEYAPQNAQFVLNLIHWLDGLENYTGPKKTQAGDKPHRILQLNRDMEAAFAENDMLKLASFYADEAYLVGNNTEITGREALDNYWLGLKDRGVDWKLENISLEVHGDVALQRGISRLRTIHEGEIYLSEVRFTLFWKKRNGAWKIYLDHYTHL